MNITILIKHLLELVDKFGTNLEVETFSDELYVEDVTGDEVETFNI